VTAAQRPSPDARARAVIVRNPRARRAVATAELRAAARVIERAGWAVTIVDTERAGHAAELARAAVADGADVVVACGGDGTVNEVINGIAGSAAALAVVPTGTANVWAREAFVSRDPRCALALIAHGRRVRVDLGELAIGDGAPRRFLLMCGAGIDAAVVRAVEARPRLKRALGRGAFVIAGAACAARLRATPATVARDGVTERHSLVLAVAGNTRLYGGVVQLAHAARIDDGLLDLVTFSTRAPERALLARRLRHVALLAAAARGGLAGRTVRGVDYRRAEAIVITPTGPLAVQADGEFVGTASPDAPLRLRALPGALTVVIAARANPLLGEL